MISCILFVCCLSVLTFLGAGMPKPKTPDQFGDVIVRFSIQFPSTIKDSDKPLLKQILAGVLTDSYKLVFSFYHFILFFSVEHCSHLSRKYVDYLMVQFKLKLLVDKYHELKDEEDGRMEAR